MTSHTGQVRVLRVVRPGDYDRALDFLREELEEEMSRRDADVVMEILRGQGLLDAPSEPGIYVEVRLDDPDAATPCTCRVTTTWGQP